LSAAAQISAARLLTAPLALVWLSYSSILRPEASRLLAMADARAQLNRLAWRSALFVATLASAYALVLWLAMPLLDTLLFAGRFEEVGGLALLWLAYFALTGMTTIATSLLRSAFEFKALFQLHSWCAGVALTAFCGGLAFHTPAAFVVALTAVEALLAALAWRLLRRTLARRATDERCGTLEALAR
jgi:O-antigen/teichoic acid export membrane protein